MTFLTSLTGLELRIIAFFVEHITESFAIREIARKTGIDYKLTHTTIQKLVQKNILLKKRQANVDLCSLNLQNDLTQVHYVEMLRAQDFLRKHHELNIFFKSTMEKIKESFYTLLVFGSYAKGTEGKHSDIDVLIITPSREPGEEIERIINAESIFLKRKVQTIVLDEKEFTANLSDKKLNVVQEAFKNHVIITGVESFYNGVKRAL
ncbi:MAG: nucleotidyltransferase domain-containing protein [Candidatus Woesearchaeota archaeon]|nr:nucleotidyltransferase domain-containing protein [Candidatus Woesearchaeota archaeon]